MILIAPTAFKGTLTAREVGAAMEAGARESADGSAEVRVLPLSDGGNGLLETMEAAAGGRVNAIRVAGPLGPAVSARYLVQEGRVVVETAEACGLHLVPRPSRDPMRASTRGVGQLLRAAATAAPGVRTLLVGLGGSATVDAGAGMAQELGWRLLDGDGSPIPPGGAGLTDLAAIEPPGTPPGLPALAVLADVANPLLGPTGAAAVYGPQKGAGPGQVDQLERGLARWAEVVERDLGRDVAALPGAGAAGGLGAAFAALLDAPPRPGADWVLDAVGFADALRSATVVVTGEGAWDEQSSMGKVTGVVVRRARESGVPVIVVTGSASGAAPEGARLVVGSGATLTADDIAGMIRDGLSGLLPRRRTR